MSLKRKSRASRRCSPAKCTLIVSLQVAVCSPTLGRLATLLRKLPFAPNVRSIHWCRPQKATFTIADILRRAAALDSALGHTRPRSGVRVCERSLRRRPAPLVAMSVPLSKHNRGRAVAARPRSAFKNSACRWLMVPYDLVVRLRCCRNLKRSKCAEHPTVSAIKKRRSP